MPDKIPDLWPADFGSVVIATPLLILKRQATALAEKTKGVVEGTVHSSADGSAFTHQFVLVSRVLGYSYRLLLVRHDIALYPANIRYEPTEKVYSAGDEETFKKTLADLLAAE